MGSARRLVAAGLLCVVGGTPPGHGPVIDMHVHAYGVRGEGPPSRMCAPFPAFKSLDPGNGGPGLPAYLHAVFGDPDCPSRYFSAASDDELRTRTIAMLRKHDVYAVAGGSPTMVARWVADAPDRIIPAVGPGSSASLPSIEALRTLFAEGKLKWLSELSFQYRGVAPDDPRTEPYWSLAEELDIAVGIHTGPGAPGTTYFATPEYRVALSDPLLLEPVLVKHPKLRIFVMHAGYPLKDRMLALMAA